ncbi:flagellin lysine-N-methylase [Photobacterium aphoticum]|uniref:Lysine-N-methylase n=1 Tax=Photobacterium aphoticum TaxID=754436 RepID=A0A0J1GMD8_9GAMM|nr:flagellin lysine-N-methylase [Photobacterium aphoticum]KLV00614.1 lysine-N-methylase [Photobacterium aphoticum]PSU53360.1 lysine-N-methylase [Photobacterium aphoticum]GHA59085.1 flagellar biosynthesis protein [Photobacterium aphoticum]
MRQIEVIPQFVEQFSCIADQCEDHCCHGWNIHIDKPTYRFMVEKSAFREKSAQVILKTPGEKAFAKIKLDAQGVCPFRDAQGLCDVHKAHGHTRLSNTCKTYPRLSQTRGERVERSLTLSCPEAARQVLLNPSAMMFSEKPLFTANAKPVPYRYPHYYDAVRQLYIDVLLMEGVALEAKLFMLGTSLKMLEAKKDCPDSFQQAFDYCVAGIVNGDFLEMYARTGSMVEMHTIFLTRLYNVHLALGITEKHGLVLQRIEQIHAQLVATLGQAGEDIEQQKAILLQGFNGHYQDYISSNPHIWLNYFLYGMYQHDFPSKGLYEVFAEQVIDFFLLRGALMAIASSRPLADNDVIHVVQSYHRARSHGVKVSKGIKGIIEKYLQVDEAMLPLLLLKVADN